MPFYRIKRHVIYKPGCQQTEEAWGIDRPAPGLHTATAPRDTDADDPLRCGDCCTILIKMADGRYVTWDRMWEWLSEAEAAGYELVSGFKKMSPYSVLVLRGPS
jgi:hypothetical protein